ncbi:MAG: TrmH family RNA methyltransferase [Pseudobdellovibrionaceae bacterium]
MGLFPFSNPLQIELEKNIHFQVDAAEVIDRIGPLLTDHRLELIDQITKKRNFSTAVVLEGIYDRGNISAVMRTAEAMGFVNFHVIETQEKFKEANRVTQGADKWVEVKKWKKTADCISELKKNNVKIYTTSLDAQMTISDIDWSQSSALVLGNEKDGVSREMMDLSDGLFKIPMNGFVQSFNISVAAAVSLYHIKLALGENFSQLSGEERELLKAIYILRTQDSAGKILHLNYQNSLAKN